MMVVVLRVGFVGVGEMVMMMMIMMIMMKIDGLRPLLGTCQAKWVERPP